MAPLFFISVAMQARNLEPAKIFLHGLHNKLSDLKAQVLWQHINKYLILCEYIKYKSQCPENMHMRNNCVRMDCFPDP